MLHDFNHDEPLEFDRLSSTAVGFETVLVIDMLWMRAVSTAVGLRVSLRDLVAVAR